MFLTNPDRFYLSYFRGMRGSQPPSEAMMLGSVFDGYVKMYLCKTIFGESSDWRQYNNEERDGEQAPDSVRKAAALVFSEYIKEGCFNRLLEEMEHSVTPPKFEQELHNTINGVPLRGFLDLYFTTKDGTVVVYDWKVNGYFGDTTTSPIQGYINYKGNPHKTAILTRKSGLIINDNPIKKREWMNQLTIYAWLLGIPVGDENHVLGIEQLVCNPPKIHTATHRVISKAGYQFELFNSIEATWLKVNSPQWQEEMEKNFGDIADAYDGSPLWNYILSITFQYQGLPSL
jgi:hypothetical protein